MSADSRLEARLRSTPLRDLNLAEVPIAVFDLETTGRSHNAHEIVEASVVRLEPGRPPRLAFDSLIKPRGRLMCSNIHHIYKRDVADAPTWEEVAPALADALSGAVWVAYNVYFDLNFTKTALADLGYDIDAPHVCAANLRSILGLGKRQKLGVTCEAFGIDFREGQHIAVYDTWMTARLMYVWLERMADLGLERYEELEMRGTHKYLKSLTSPIWYAPEALTRGAEAAYARQKSRYAIDLQEAGRDPRELTPLSREPSFDYNAWHDQARARRGEPVVMRTREELFNHSERPNSQRSDSKRLDSQRLDSQRLEALEASTQAEQNTTSYDLQDEPQGALREEDQEEDQEDDQEGDQEGDQEDDLDDHQETHQEASQDVSSSDPTSTSQLSSTPQIISAPQITSTSRERPHRESFKLRPYQEEAINAILSARRAGLKRLVVCLPTGAGKTVIFSQLASIARRRVLVLAHREELLTQAKDKLQRALGDAARVEIEQASKSASADAKVVVASLRSLRAERLQRLLGDGGFGLIIYDECHHAVAEDNQRVLRDLGVFEPDFEGTLVGFTATTRRGDGLGLEEVFEELVYSRGLQEMIQDKFLVPLRGYRISTSITLERIGGSGDFPIDELEERVDIQERNGLVARSIQELARDRRTICFCVTVRHAENLARTLRDCGVPTGVIHGEMKSVERAEVLRAFREGTLQVLTNVGVLTEGFDDPEVSCVAMARPTRSEALYVQCVGRGMRLFEGKEDCLVLDFVDLSALNLITLPSLYGVPVEVDFEGREASEAAAAYHALFEESPGFEWEAETLTLTELKERARQFDPLRLKVSPEVRAISQSGWVSLGQRGLALHFSRDGSQFSELTILLTSEQGKRRYQICLDQREVGRAALIEQAVEASDYELSRMGPLAVETASMYAEWRVAPATPELIEPLRAHRLPRPPETLEEVFRALSFYQYAPQKGSRDLIPPIR